MVSFIGQDRQVHSFFVSSIGAADAPNVVMEPDGIAMTTAVLDVSLVGRSTIASLPVLLDLTVADNLVQLSPATSAVTVTQTDGNVDVEISCQ